MKRQYRRLRIALITFTLGLAAVRFGDGLETAWNTVNVDLPEAQSDVLFVFPIEKKYMCSGGSHGRCNYYQGDLTDLQPLRYRRNVDNRTQGGRESR